LNAKGAPRHVNILLIHRGLTKQPACHTTAPPEHVSHLRIPERHPHFPTQRYYQPHKLYAFQHFARHSSHRASCALQSQARPSGRAMPHHWKGSCHHDIIDYGPKLSVCLAAGSHRQASHLCGFESKPRAESTLASTDASISVVSRVNDCILPVFACPCTLQSCM
jgi:hypothetical protein